MPPSIVVVPMNQSSYEKNGWSAQMATQRRGPCSARASLTAAVSAVEPSLVNFTISAPSIDRQELPRRTRARWRPGRVKFVPSASDARTASTTGGIGVAERHGAQAHAVLDELVAVGVPDVAAEAARDERRGRARGTGRRPWRRCGRRPARRARRRAASCFPRVNSIDPPPDLLPRAVTVHPGRPSLRPAEALCDPEETSMKHHPVISN